MGKHEIWALNIPGGLDVWQKKVFTWNFSYSCLKPNYLTSIEPARQQPGPVSAAYT